jgi:hypothetical protein
MDDRRLASVLYGRMMEHHTSVLDFVRRREFKSQRSFHEARRIAQAVDALVKDGARLRWTGMEMLLRNLSGICEADRLDEVGILEAFELRPPQQLLPRQVLRTVLKDVARAKKLRSGRTSSSSAPARSNRVSASSAPRGRGGQRG